MISVILTYYKKKKFIKKCLKSITNQTYRNFESILVYEEDDKEERNGKTVSEGLPSVFL